jgi:hypothetical protein
MGSNILLLNMRIVIKSGIQEFTPSSASPRAQSHTKERVFPCTEVAQGVLWVQEQRRKERPDLSQKIVSVCQLPFCINPEGKAKILKLESDIQKIEYRQAARELVRPPPPPSPAPSHTFLICYLPTVQNWKTQECGCDNRCV